MRAFVGRALQTVLLVMAGLVIPNALFTGGAFFGIALEPRTIAIAVYCLLFAFPLPTWALLSPASGRRYDAVRVVRGWKMPSDWKGR